MDDEAADEHKGVARVGGLARRLSTTTIFLAGLAVVAVLLIVGLVAAKVRNAARLDIQAAVTADTVIVQGGTDLPDGALLYVSVQSDDAKSENDGGRSPAAHRPPSTADSCCCRDPQLGFVAPLTLLRLDSAS